MTPLLLSLHGCAVLFLYRQAYSVANSDGSIVKETRSGSWRLIASSYADGIAFLKKETLRFGEELSRLANEDVFAYLSSTRVKKY